MSEDTSKQELDIDGNPAGVEDDELDMDNLSPFDPDKIRLRTQPFSLDQCLGRIKQGTLNLAPDFQRSFVWDKKRQSQLIESLMLKIPLPMFYVSSDARENFHVVDGLQRLTTLRNFILDPEARTDSKDERFKLEGLEFWTELNGKMFNDLEVYLQNRILETTLQMTIIEYQTPEKVKRNVFKRLNTGGMPLTSQEIRHALYQGASTVLLKNLVETKEFKDATGASIRDSRMVGREIILRFLSFIIFNIEDYKGDMDDFLSTTMEKINGFSPERRKELEEIFLLSMRRAYCLFKSHCFRRSLPIDDKKTSINKSLFEVWSVLLSDLKENDFRTLLTKKDILYKKLKNLYSQEKFQRAISRDSWKTESIRMRYREIKNAIDETIRG